MSDQLLAAPVLSTPDVHIFEDDVSSQSAANRRLTADQIYDVYEIERTAKEIRAGGWQTIALQFPDGMLCDAPGVSDALQSALLRLANEDSSEVDGELAGLSISDMAAQKRHPRRERLAILADTSYGSCCVDEIAAEHANAEVVVHYGRSCLSPTARLSVIYVYTTRELDHESVVASFEASFPDATTKVILMTDITYSSHLTSILRLLAPQGYANIFVPEIIHDPSSPLPNRTIPDRVKAGAEKLSDYHLFHISDPPPALLLTLSSRVQSTIIYPTDTPSPSKTAAQAQTSRSLMRRYALITSLATCPIFGILVNTLSVKNYISTISQLQSQITAAGKKYYTMVVGKVNPAKLANFSEIGGWVVVGCWESSLIESKEFYRPVITPFELNLALQSDEERVWTGEWRSDFTGFLESVVPVTREKIDKEVRDEATAENAEEQVSDEEDSAPPEYDLRTGRYVSNSRPMRQPHHITSQKVELEGTQPQISNKLIKRAEGHMAMINGAASPGAEYLRENRTWQGLGSDYEIKYEEERGAAVEEGRSGVARGYTVGEESTKH